jgi:hypothetical protein
VVLVIIGIVVVVEEEVDLCLVQDFLSLMVHILLLLVNMNIFGITLLVIEVGVLEDLMELVLAILAVLLLSLLFPLLIHSQELVYLEDLAVVVQRDQETIPVEVVLNLV